MGGALFTVKLIFYSPIENYFIDDNDEKNVLKNKYLKYLMFQTLPTMYTDR